MNRTTFDPGPLADVDREADGERSTLVLVRTLRHPPERVWRALTDPAELGRWAPYTADRDLGQVGAACLTMIDGENRQDLAAAVSVADAPRVLEYTWGADVLRWELAADGRGTRLTLRHTVADPAMLARVAAGWHLCLVVAEHLLAGDAVDPIRGEDARNYGWEALHDAYARALGD